FSFILLRIPSRLTLFPYTTLFRSNAISLVFAHRMMEHPKLVAQDLLRRKNDARHLGVAEVGVGGDESAHVAKIHQPFNDLSMLGDRKSTRLNSSHEWISYAVFCFK